MIYHFALCLEVPGNQMGPRGTAPNDKSLKSFISGAAPLNPLALPLETPWRCASKPQVEDPFNGSNFHPFVIPLFSTEGALRLPTTNPDTRVSNDLGAVHTAPEEPILEKIYQ